MTDLSRLPKYWVVKNDGSQLFRDTVIKALNEIGTNSVFPWIGNVDHSYYGFDGAVTNSGTCQHENVSDCRNKPTILTLEQFIELTTELPTEWTPKRGDVVLVTDDDDDAVWHERIYLATIKGAYMPYITVSHGDEYLFDTNQLFDINEWQYMKPILDEVEPIPTKLTVAEIEEKLGYKVEIVSDKV